MRVCDIEMFVCRFLYFSFFLRRHIFAVHDRDHCGAIDFKEFVMAVSHEIPHDLDSHIEFTFAM